MKQFCETFAERAFRRPLTDVQRQAYVDAQFADQNDTVAAVKRSILLALKSPFFLYPHLPQDTGRDAYDTAAHIAPATWDSLPDAALLQAAAQGQLTSREQVRTHARRLASDPRAEAKLRSFFAHWLQLDQTEHVAKDNQTFTGFDESLISDLRTSLELFLDTIIRSETADYRELLLAKEVFANDRLAEFYGLEVPADGRFHRIPFGAEERAGVITHPYMLASLSYTHTTSPIHRGVFAARKLLNRPLNPPPMAIEFTDVGFDPHLTMREMVAELTKAEACQGCHRIINPLGFSLENFDATGRFRTIEKEQPVNAVSDYELADGETVHLTGARDLAEFAANSKAAQLGFIEQLFHHTVKQPAAAYGESTLEDLHRAFVDSQYNIRELLVEIVVTTAQVPAD